MIVLKYRKIQRQGKSANVYRSTSKRKSNSFFSHEKKTQQQRNEQLASENYLPNTFSLIMYA